MIKVLKQLELGRLAAALVLVCLVLYLLFYLFKGGIISAVFSNEVIVTAQGSFNKETVVIKMLSESGTDTLVIYDKGKSEVSFKPHGFTQFFVFQSGNLIADFEHIKEDTNIGNTYHFYFSANRDSIFMDLKVEGVGSGR